MPTTSKRGYPYPNYTGEAPNVPLALEKLATAIDEDFTTVSHSIDTALADSLESRAALLEGRVTTLENRKILSKTITLARNTYETVDTGIPWDKYIGGGMTQIVSCAYSSDHSPATAKIGATAIKLGNGNVGIQLELLASISGRGRLILGDEPYNQGPTDSLFTCFYYD
ncbi:hypothetical protein [Mobiluncus curtisii]|uniref:Uncharacterized protein n=1 Tax=Mobiluncus curtisii ATCC 51333 TaxID=887326 RepID=E6M0Z4_9ACTO|nr:hypothetical protein [Mobiluncus curtisii]EFU79624.1 hypothetical protein HMPREF0388_1727 [Mobiluncus curtisii ATCC 51333]